MRRRKAVIDGTLMGAPAARKRATSRVRLVLIWVSTKTRWSAASITDVLLNEFAVPIGALVEGTAAVIKRPLEDRANSCDKRPASYRTG